jgi:SAM-dependent methyltransferase
MLNSKEVFSNTISNLVKNNLKYIKMRMKNLKEMLEVNKTQAKFYDSISIEEDLEEMTGYSKHKKANILTKVWASFRYRQQLAFTSSGLETIKTNFHQKWIDKKTGGDVLEIGCFRGTRSSWPLIESAGNYVGIDLSVKAIEALNDKIFKAGLSSKAKAFAVDFFLIDNEKKYDLIFAHGVLHHFENPEPLFSKISEILNDDGILIITEPSTVNPLFKLVRSIFRPFQSDAAWEWPFTKKTISVLESKFKPIDGFGWGRRSLWFSILIGIPLIEKAANPIYKYFLNKEINAGYNKNVWLNSTVTSVYKKI